MTKEELMPIEIILKEMEKYTPITIDMFNYLNGNINPYNPCNLYIKMYNTTNFAEFRKPNTVTVFLGSIITIFYGQDLDIKSVILMTLAHELSHSWQNTDMVRYTYDPYYKQMIEDTNEGYTEKWISDHMKEIHKLFGFKVQYSRWAKKNILPKAVEYQSANLKDYFIHTIVDVVYRDSKYIKPLNDVFDKEQTILFSIDDSEIIILKLNGMYLEQSIQSFGQILFNHCRAGLGIKYFKVAVYLQHCTLKPEYNNVEGVWLRFILEDVRYCPIVGIETVPQIESMDENK